VSSGRFSGGHCYISAYGILISRVLAVLAPNRRRRVIATNIGGSGSKRLVATTSELALPILIAVWGTRRGITISREGIRD